MSYSFDEIMDYHSSNRNVYDEIKRYLPRLVPFVGAGLTQFAYYSWDKALEELSKMITNRKSKQEVKKLIKSKLYDEAAQKLEDFRTPANLALDLAALFSADKLELKKEDLPKQAIFLLPYLFPELVLTTNFDETLETVYNQSGQPSRVYFPGHPMLLTQLLRQGDENLYFVIIFEIWI